MTYIYDLKYMYVTLNIHMTLEQLLSKKTISFVGFIFYNCICLRNAEEQICVTISILGHVPNRKINTCITS